jgi:glycosyltransferase involved in cell wall biosynthesis
VIHPSVHAAGERRWLKTEAPLGLSDDSRLRVAVVTAWLGLRARRQRADARRALGVLALSQHFADEIVADYGVDRARVRVVPNCVQIDDVPVVPVDPRTLVSVGRLVVRKGLEDVAALSKRLAAIDVDLRIDVIGAPSLWSDNRRALASADASCLRMLGPLPRAEVVSRIAQSLALLQLSRYEPFGLTVAEALSVGVPVIVTAQVGAAEEVADDVKVVVSAGDIDALTDAVRSLVELRADERDLLAARCRREAEQLFAPSVVAARLVAALDSLLG